MYNVTPINYLQLVNSNEINALKTQSILLIYKFCFTQVLFENSFAILLGHLATAVPSFEEVHLPMEL